MEHLFVTTLVFLGAAIVMVPFVRKLGLSSVIGYILGGVAIGPYVLGFTGSADHVMHATEFGVVMLLFMVGLELEPKKFWAMRKNILGLGLTQLLGTAILLLVIFSAAGWGAKEAITVGLCFAMSSTAIVLQTLKEKNQFHTASGEASFSILLFQDMAVIPILAFLPWLANPNAEQINDSALLINMLPTWLKPFSVFIGVGILIILGRYVFVPFLRYVATSGMNELLVATSLFLVVGVSQLMILVGLSPALGAFLAGVMLANSEFRHELESNIDPFKGLLLAVFFVSVGSTINFNIIFQNPVFIFAVVFVVLVVKFVVLFGVGRLFKMSKSQNFLMSFGLSQVGEFAFVLLTFSNKIYLLDNDLTSQLMAVVAISMCLTPLLLILNEKYIAPRLNQPKEVKMDNSESIEKGEGRIIIVGYGHFGSTVGRLLRINGFTPTILDHDSDRVHLLREHGVKAFYGDATRKEILRLAGAETADMLVLCLDNPLDNFTIVESVKEHFPHLKLFVRSRNRLDTYDFLNTGVDIDNIYRETLGTAVKMGVDVLHAAGMRSYAAHKIGNRFELIDNKSTIKIAAERLKDSPTFSLADALEHEIELLKEDNITLKDKNWMGMDS